MQREGGSHSLILSLKNQQISQWKEMDWEGVGKYGELEVDIQRAFSVIPTIAIKWNRWKWTFAVTVLFQQTGKFFQRQPFPF